MRPNMANEFLRRTAYLLIPHIGDGVLYGGVIAGRNRRRFPGKRRRFTLLVIIAERDACVRQREANLIDTRILHVLIDSRQQFLLSELEFIQPARVCDFHVQTIVFKRYRAGRPGDAPRPRPSARCGTRNSWPAVCPTALFGGPLSGWWQTSWASRRGP